MKKVILLALACLLVFTVPVMAAEVDAKVNFQNDAKFDVNFFKAKAILELKVVADIFVTTIFVDLDPDSRAMSQVVKKQINEDNEFNLTNVKYTDQLLSSFNDFSGIGQVNQAAGSMNNQANIVSAAIATGALAWASSEVIDCQLNDHLRFDPGLSDPNVFTDLIDNSFNRFTGIGQVNQSAGMANNQNNIVSIAASKGILAAESDVFLDQVNVANNLFDSGVTRTNTINASFNGFRGIGQANQSAGNFNNQSNVVSVSAAITR
jgi:hypothetical protein